MSYRNLEIWKLARELVVDTHQMSLLLPKFEQFEEAQQIRRSMKSVKSNIAEGYGRRKYKLEFIRFLIFANASLDETINHLETLYETGSLKEEKIFRDLLDRLNILGRKLISFIKAVELRHNDF